MNLAQQLWLETQPSIFKNASLIISLRKFPFYNGNCIEARRLSDNATLDIGFVDGYIDTASLLSFAGSDSVSVNKIYNQGFEGGSVSSGANNVIVDSGNLTLDTNGLVSFYCSILVGDYSHESEQYSMFYAGRMGNSSPAHIVRGNIASGYVIYGHPNGSLTTFRNNLTTYNYDRFYTAANLNLLEAYSYSEVLDTTVNGVDEPQRTLTGTFEIGDIMIRTRGLFQELVMFKENLPISKRQIIRTEINNYYNIF